MFNCTYMPPIDTGLGYIHIYADNVGVTRIEFSENGNISEKLNDHTELCRRQIEQYFTEGRTEFSVPLHLIGTPFQMKTWQVLMKIPYGETWSYKEQALALGSANYARAVGLANSKNPVSIIVPCHRVIGTNHTLTGYAGGLNRKKTLLMLENNLFDSKPQ